MPDTMTATDPQPMVTSSDLINPSLKVADVMTHAPRTCSPASSVLEASLVMRDANCGAIPVIDAGRPVGLLTDRDIAMALPEHGDGLARTPVGEIMTERVVIIDRDAMLEQALILLGCEGVRRILVVAPDGLIVGILSWTDLIPHVSDRCLGKVVARIVANR